MSLFLDTKKSSYRAIRAASQGASVSLFHGCGEYVAMDQCALSVARVLGGRGMWNDGFPEYKIPVEEMSSALLKLSAKHSIALVEAVCGGDGIRFVLLWKIPVTEQKSSVDPQPPSLNLDDY